MPEKQQDKNKAIAGVTDKASKMLRKGDSVAIAAPTLKLSFTITMNVTSIVDEEDSFVSPMQKKMIMDAADDRINYLSKRFNKLKAELKKKGMDVVDDKLYLTPILICTPKGTTTICNEVYSGGETNDVD